MKNIKTLCNEIKNSDNKNIDKKVLLLAVDLVYYCFLKKSELIDLQLKDVVKDSNGKPIKIEIKNKDNSIKFIIILNNIFGEYLGEYINYLQNNGYNTSETSPVIPHSQKDKGKYRTKTLGRHIKNFGVTLEKIRQAGIKNLYKSGVNIKDIARRARLTDEHVKAILNDKIQPPGQSLTDNYDICLRIWRRTDEFNFKGVITNKDLEEIKKHKETVSKILENKGIHPKTRNCCQAAMKELDKSSKNKVDNNPKKNPDPEPTDPVDVNYIYNLIKNLDDF
jgi:hypothetical protein